LIYNLYTTIYIYIYIYDPFIVVTIIVSGETNEFVELGVTIFEFFEPPLVKYYRSWLLISLFFLGLVGFPVNVIQQKLTTYGKDMDIFF